MCNNFPDWLTKEMISGVRRFNLDAYLLALEGWRRGLTLNWYYNSEEVTDLQLVGFNPIGKTFSLSSESKTHFFYRSRGDKAANEAVTIASSKEATKQSLIPAGIPVPEGVKFTKDNQDYEIMESLSALTFPLVIKPTYGSLGKGVITNIQNKKELMEGLESVRSNKEYNDFVVEQYISGHDLRVYVVDNQVISALKRIPANVTGDGKHTITDLIGLKNKGRMKNPCLSTKLINPDQEMEEYLKRQSLTLNSVPDKNVVIYLRGTSNVSSGGDSHDVTDELTSSIKEIAVNAVAAMPGLSHGGVDLIVKDNKAVVIEINATADIAMHIFPMYGTPRNIPKGIIDYYFPDTKGQSDNRNRVYYDHKAILDLLRKKTIKKAEVTDAPNGEIFAKRFVVSGNVQGVGYRNWIRKKALEHNLNGYTRNLNNGKVVVVVGGTQENKINEFKNVCYEGPSRAEVKDIQEYVWDKRIKVGFEIKSTN